jgi:hypothetical protein
MISGLVPVASLFLSAGPAESRFQTEIDSLLAHLKHSQCQFQRNGSWFDANTAVAHLQKKREYLTRKNRLQSAEDFVLLGATSSSVSGKEYSVKCADGKIVASKLWLLRELRAIRTNSP